MGEGTNDRHRGEVHGERPLSQGLRTFVHNHATRSRRSTCSWCRRSRLGLCWTSHPAAVTARAPVAGQPIPMRNDLPSADRGLRLGRASTLDPRPRRRVWRCLHPAHPSHGDSRPIGLGADGNVLITSSSLASAIFATFSHRTKNYYNEVGTHLSLQ
jgi:hypothetical protein